MANTTKSTRKKTSSSAAASKGSKTTKKANSKKPAVVKSEVKSSSKKNLSPLELLRSMHISLAIAYTAFAAIVIGFITTVAVPVTLGIQARDEFASRDHVVLGPAYEVFYNLQPKYVLAAALILSALASVLLATKWRNRYEATLAGRVSGMRWLTLGLSSALTITFVSMLAGVHDLALLKLSGGLVFLTTVLAWLADRDNATAGRSKWFAYGFSLVAGALAWLPIVISLVGTSVYGMERFGWHVYAISIVTLLGFTAFAVTQYRQIKAGKSGKDYVDVESTFLRADLFTKFAIVLIAVFALQ